MSECSGTFHCSTVWPGGRNSSSQASLLVVPTIFWRPARLAKMSIQRNYSMRNEMVWTFSWHSQRATIIWAVFNPSIGWWLVRGSHQQKSGIIIIHGNLQQIFILNQQFLFLNDQLAICGWSCPKFKRISLIPWWKSWLQVLGLWHMGLSKNEGRTHSKKGHQYHYHIYHAWFMIRIWWQCRTRFLGKLQILQK